MSSLERNQLPQSRPSKWTVRDDELAAFQFSQSILDRRYALEAWLDSRSNWLLSIQSILVGVVLVFATKANLHEPAIAFVAASLFALLVGVGVSLYRSIPRFRSRRQMAGDGEFGARNPRTTFGIETFGAHEYRDLMCSLSISEMVAYNADQIRQVNAVLIEELKISVVPVLATAVGLLAAVLAVVTQIFW
jgi:hypothetical protein